MNRWLVARTPTVLSAICLSLVLLLAGTAANAALSAPASISATSSPTNIQIQWSPVSDPGVRGYLVYYDTDGPEPPFDGTGADEGDSPVRVFGAETSSLTLHGLDPNSRYYFVVTAFDENNLPGQMSTGAQGALCDVLNPAAPVGLGVILETDGVHLSWVANHEVDAWGTIIFRDTNPFPTDSIGFVTLPTALYFEKRPGIKQTYYYRLQAVDFCGLKSSYSDVVSVAIPDTLPEFTRSDVDANGEVDISDPIYNLAYQFQGGPAPPCLEAADDDDSGEINVADPIYSLNYQFGGGPAPTAPFPDCGIDPTPDGLGCVSFPPCGTTPPPPVPPRPTNGQEVLALGTGTIDSETATFPVILQTGTPLLGVQGTFSYPADLLDFVGLQRTDYSQAWDFISAKANATNGTISLGAVPSFQLQNPISPSGQTVANLVFHVKSDPSNNPVLVTQATFVSSNHEEIAPTLEQPSSVPGHGQAQFTHPVLLAPNPFRAGSVIQLAGGARGLNAEVALFRVTGERIRVLYHGVLDGSVKAMPWDGRTQTGRNAGTGLYYVRAQVGPHSVLSKIVLLP